ncbi:MAG: hypothetical protein CL917_02620 [Deltaproteobacteria bacterium]|nr:hypothetical protein [Deltaproteobacteria bacterium]
MLPPELRRDEKNSMRASPQFWQGLWRRWRGKAPQEKIFIIGFHKTGTSSYGRALQRLGCRVASRLREGQDYQPAEDGALPTFLAQRAESVLEEFDAFQDTPWFLMYEEIFERYPDSRFILTLRDEKAWLKSVQRHFAKKFFPYHEAIYGSLDSFENAESYLRCYRAHNEAVRTFFKGRGHLLEVDLKESDWKTLANFLKVPCPSGDFPHANQGDDRGLWVSKLRDQLKQLYYGRG